MVNNGLIVYHAIAGKNTIGTARPGKSSGNLTFNGNDIEMGIITQAKDTIENKKLNTISPFFFHDFTNTQYSIPTSIHTIIFNSIILPVFSTREKSASVAKK
jgi:hypothetical protein